jgi:hypothetical protein
MQKVPHGACIFNEPVLHAQSLECHRLGSQRRLTVEGRGGCLRRRVVAGSFQMHRGVVQALSMRFPKGPLATEIDGMVRMTEMTLERLMIGLVMSYGSIIKGTTHQLQVRVRSARKS